MLLGPDTGGQGIIILTELIFTLSWKH